MAHTPASHWHRPGMTCSFSTTFVTAAPMLLSGWKPFAANVRASSGVPDYIHVVDLADGHVAALNYLNQKGGLLTVSTGQGYSVLDMIKAFEQASRRSSPKRSPSAPRATSPSAGPIPAWRQHCSAWKATQGWSKSAPTDGAGSSTAKHARQTSRPPSL